MNRCHRSTPNEVATPVVNMLTRTHTHTHTHRLVTLDELRTISCRDTHDGACWPFLWSDSRNLGILNWSSAWLMNSASNIRGMWTLSIRYWYSVNTAWTQCQHGIGCVNTVLVVSRQYVTIKCQYGMGTVLVEFQYGMATVSIWHGYCITMVSVQHDTWVHCQYGMHSVNLARAQC